MARTPFIEVLESRRLLSGTLGAGIAEAVAPQAIVVSPDRKSIVAPKSIDGITNVEIVKKFRGVKTDVFKGAEYETTHTRKHFTTVGINLTYSASGTYSYSHSGNIGTIVSDADGVRSTTIFTYTSRHAGTFVKSFGPGVYISGTFTD